MSVRELGTKVATHVNLLLKPLGFKRNKAIFLRETEAYSERYAISGSRWNSGEEPWKFSLDVGVFFVDIPPRDGAKGLWRYSHAIGGTDQILKHSPPDFSVTQSNVEEISRQVADIILKTSATLPSIVGPAYQRALHGFASPLPVPETWGTYGEKG